MEGSATWSIHMQTQVHDMFDIKVVTNSDFVFVDSVIGINEDYTKDMIFSLKDEFYYSYATYFIQPEEIAVPWLIANVSDTAGVVIANQTENYSTVASTIQFGTIIDTDTTNQKDDYLISILDFFDVKKYIYADIPQTEYTFSKIEIYPNPAKDKLTIRFFNATNNSSYYQILNIQGKLIKEQRISDGGMYENSTTIVWDCKDMNGKSLPRGIYLLRFVSGNNYVTKKIILN